jgi:hypothetical protein
MRIINEKVATCYYKSERTVVRNNHLKVITKEIELIFCECKAKSTYYSYKSKAKKKLFKD